MTVSFDVMVNAPCPCPQLGFVAQKFKPCTHKEVLIRQTIAVPHPFKRFKDAASGKHATRRCVCLTILFTGMLGMRAMGKVALSAAAGIVVAGVLLAVMYLGIRLPPALLMSIAAALSVGAATAVLTRYAIDRPRERPRGNELLGKRLRDVKELVASFPRGGGAVQLSVKPDTLIDELEVVKNPATYATKEITVTLKDSGKGNGPASVFNPVTLKRFFVALKDQANFLHVVLLDKHDEFLGYIPSFRAKSEFTGGNAEGQIGKF